MVNLRKVLGVSRHVEGAAIKIAFRTLAKVHHPDLHGGDKLAERRFQTITSAYGVLSKPDQRAASMMRRCAFVRAAARTRMKSAAVTMTASFLLTVTSGLALAGWMRD